MLYVLSFCMQQCSINGKTLLVVSKDQKIRACKISVCRTGTNHLTRWPATGDGRPRTLETGRDFADRVAVFDDEFGDLEPGAGSQGCISV